MKTSSTQENNKFLGFIFRPDKKVLSFGEFDVKKDYSKYEHFFVNLDGEDFFVLCSKSQARNLYYKRCKEIYSDTFTPIVEENLQSCTDIQIHELIYGDDSNLMYKELYRKATGEKYIHEDYAR